MKNILKYSKDIKKVKEKLYKRNILNAAIHKNIKLDIVTIVIICILSIKIIISIFLFTQSVYLLKFYFLCKNN